MVISLGKNLGGVAFEKPPLSAQYQYDIQNAIEASIFL